MKFTAIILLSACLTASANGYSQITLSEKNAPLQKVFKEIQKQSGYDFFYTYELLQQAGAVTVRVNNVSLEKALEESLKGKDLTYEIVNKTVVIKEKIKEPIKEELPPPPITVRGRVVNENGEPVVASVLVKGTNNGTTTNADGYFELKNVDENATLVITGVSLEQTVEIKVNGRADVGSIATKTKVATGEEITINAGYYTVKDKERTGNISRVDAKTIEKQPVLNPLQALQGRMAGVYIQQRSGMPGGGFTVEIRGRNSLRTGTGNTPINGNLPLYVIDGVPFTSTSLLSAINSSSNLHGGNPLSTINPSDIESIEVLKDADATAIYGSRGANGVVLITTKKGKAGKTKVDINVFQGAGKVGHTMNLLNTQQYQEMRREALENDGYTSLLSDPTYDIYWPDLKIWDTTRYTDWQKVLIGGTAEVTNAQATVSGGNANTQFLFGGSYYKEGTVFPGDKGFKRGGGHFSLSHNSDNGRFQSNLSVTYTESTNDLPTADLTRQAITLAPNAPTLYDSFGQLNWENNTWSNPLASLLRDHKSTIGNLISSSVLSYELMPGLSVKTSFGYTKMQVNEATKLPLSSFSPTDLVGRTGRATVANSYSNTWIIEPQLNYKNEIGKGNLDILIGTTFQEEMREGQTIEGTGYTSDGLLGNILAAVSTKVIAANYSQYRYNAVFGRINYNWQKKYFINFTARRDGSSRFGPNKQFGNFGAIGMGWIFSNESFVQKNLGFLSFGKIRTSYGTTGSDAIGDYQYLNTYTPTTYPYNASTGLMLTRLNNPDYSWETNKKLEAALEIGVLKDRINLGISWYRNRSTNQLVGLPLPLLTGQSSVQFNFPATVENRGWEFELNSENIKAKYFQWSTSFNLAFPKNELIEFPDIDKFPAFLGRYEVGKSLFINKAYQYTGVNPQTGIYTFKDLNGDGALSSLDYVGLTEVTQKFYGGINNSIKYKGLQLDVFFQFVKQTGFNYLRTFNIPGEMTNLPVVVMDRWQNPGDISAIQQFTFIDPTGNVITAWSNLLSSDKVVSDASFIRLKNVSLSWQLPEKWTRKVKLQNSRIYIQGQNLLTITDYIGFDPENQNAAFLPPLKMISAGIQITL